jgi:hypothetical protein
VPVALTTSGRFFVAWASNLSIVNDLDIYGQFFNPDGTRSGNQVAIDTRGEVVEDNTRSVLGVHIKGSLAPKIKLPNEKAGSLMVFKVYDRMSYGLTVNVTTPIRIGDKVRTP